MQEERKLDLKPYQVFVLGKHDPREGPQFILTPDNIDEEMKRRGLGNTPYLNLRLIQKFDAADDGDFGGDATFTQLTMFQNDSPVHYNQLAGAILKKAYGKDAEGKSTEPDWVDSNGETFPLIKLNGVFKNSHVEVRRVKPAYMVFKKGDDYELQMTDRKIGGEWDSYPSTIEIISKFFGGNDANPEKIEAVMAKEAQRRYVDAFNCEEIDALASKLGKTVTPEWISEIATDRIKAVFNRTKVQEENTEVTTENNATASPTITEGEKTGQPAAEAEGGTVQATGTEGTETV